MARSKRGSDENLFSISGAATALSRSRRTISKALDGVKPDAIRHGLPLWRMQTIVDNVNRRTQAPIITTAVRQGDQVLVGAAAECALAFERYDRAYAEMCALPSLSERRAAAYGLAPLLHGALEAMAARDTDAQLHEEHVQLRGDKIRLLMVRGIESLCQWNFDQAWQCLVNHGEGDEEEAA